MQLVNNFRVRVLAGACVVVLLLVGASAFGGTIYVEEGASGAGSSWADAYGSLQDALDDAAYGDEIWVAAGTYYPDPDRRNNPRRACFQMINGVAIYGGFDGTETALEQRDAQNNETILSGDLASDDGPDFTNNDDNCYRVFYHPEGINLDVTAILDGFTITAGNANGSGDHNFGGGMYNWNSSPTVTNCTFSSNWAEEDGGGMYNYDSSPTVTNCTFSGNSAYGGGGMYNKFSSPTVTNCIFSDNLAYRSGFFGGGGGGMYNDNNSSPTVSNCIFSSNWSIYGGGGGMYNSGGSSTVTNCTFSGNSAVWGGGMFNDYYSSPIVTDCTFSGNLANGTYGGGGGMFNGRSSPTVSNCVFSGNSANGEIYGNGGGMCNWLSNSTVTNCIFSGNSANDGGGMYDDNSSLTVTNCTFVGNTAENGNGLACDSPGQSYPSDIEMINCIVWNGGSEIWNNDGSTITIIYSDVQGGWPAGLGNIDMDPAFIDADGADDIVGTEDDNLRLQADSVCIDVGDSTVVTMATDLDGQSRIMDGDGNGTFTVDMGAYEYQLFVYGDIVYVDQDATSGANNGLSWEDAFLSLQDALYVAAGNPNQIWVAEGTYYPTIEVGGTGDRYKTFQMKSGVAIYGGFPAGGDTFANRDPDQYETILSGDIGVPGEISDNCYHVFYHPEGISLDATAILDGFTITAGNANDSGDHLSGGGMYNWESSPTVTNCTFSGNSADDSGGGMWNDDYSSPTVMNCTFSGNSADDSGGGMYNDSTSPTVSNCTFSDNSANGTSSRSGGGGMYNYWYSSPTVTNCIFSGNLANGTYGGGGGMYNEASSPTITDCTFIGNQALWSGGGMCNDDYSNPTVSNCTFTGNSAGNRGGGMLNDSSSPTVSNCTFSDNSANEYNGGGMYNYYSSNPTVSNCVFSSNSALSGGGMYNYYNNSPTITNCVFSGNSAEDGGGGIYNRSISNLIITNCAFSGNSADFGGGMYTYYNSSPIVTHCIFWGNTASSAGNEIYNYDHSTPVSSTPVISYCDIAGCLTGGTWNSSMGDNGGGNIDADPVFVDADGADGIIGTEDDDLRLSADSVCIDAGDNGAVTVAIDLDGQPRIVDGDGDGVGVVDMGAYEYSVSDPLGLLEILAQGVIDLELQQGIENRLLVKLDAAISKLEDDNEKNDAAAINSLVAFINAVEAQSGKKISEEEAEALIAAAQQIIDLSGSE